MPVLIYRKFLSRIFHMLQNLRFSHVLLFVLGHMAVTWALMHHFEPDAEYTKPSVYWYFYMVTISTVGYGDFSPATLGSRITVVFGIMPIGIAIFGVLVGKVSVIFIEIADKFRRGRMQLHLENHIVVVGDHSPRTIDLLENLLADTTAGDVVLLSTRTENPLNGRLAGFVSGEVDDLDVCKRACLEKARTVIVLADRDIKVTGRVIAVMDVTPKEVEIIAYFEHKKSAEKLNRQSPNRVRTVISVDMDAVVQEALDPGAAGFTRQLLRNDDGETYMRLEVPENVTCTFLEASIVLMRSRVNLLGVYEGEKPVICPDPNLAVTSGNILAVAALDRGALSTVNWNSL